jgi:ribokinase
MSAAFDILGLGSVSIDEVLRVESWPAPDTKLRVQSRERRLGGLTGLALAAAAKLGARCAYAGRLGTDEDSHAVNAALNDAGIDTVQAVVDSAYGVVRSTVITATREGTRNVFSHPASTTGAHETLPADEIIRKSRVLMIDHHGIDGSIRAAHVAGSAGIPIVADFERDDHPRFPELLELVDHLILSWGFAKRVTGAESTAEAIASLWNSKRETVILTTGVTGCWVRERHSSKVERHPAIHIEATDTTGCGDVFHGAYAAALAQTLDLPGRLMVASAAAAFKASRHALGTWEEIDNALLRRFRGPQR